MPFHFRSNTYVDSSDDRLTFTKQTACQLILDDVYGYTASGDTLQLITLKKDGLLTCQRRYSRH
jgi:hypothetical protein